MEREPAGMVMTVGHSNRDLDEFITLLSCNGIQKIIDVRAFPGSRRQPHFGAEALERSLAHHDIGYRHLRDLGGRRRASPDVDAIDAGGWRNVSFRAYAHYAQTDTYGHALADLRSEGSSARVAIMCSEAVPWRCHRWLISDTLVARRWRVLHIIGDRSVRAHLLTSFAVVSDQHVSWPGPPSTAPLRLAPAARG